MLLPVARCWFASLLVRALLATAPFATLALHALSHPVPEVMASEATTRELNRCLTAMRVAFARRALLPEGLPPRATAPWEQRPV